MCKELSIHPSNQLRAQNKEDIGDFFKNFNLSSNAQEDSIHHFMSELINNYQLQVNGETYYFEEIEFYYYAPNHEDKPVIYRQQKAGDIFFHGYGFDICFETTENSYGGILVRSLYKQGEDEESSYLILGPKSCLTEVIRNLTATCELKLAIRKSQTPDRINHLFCGPRKLGTIKNKHDYKEALYRYFTHRILQTNDIYSKKMIDSDKKKFKVVDGVIFKVSKPLSRTK